MVAVPFSLPKRSPAKSPLKTILLTSAISGGPIELDVLQVVRMELEEGAASRRARFEFDKHNPQQQAEAFDCLYENTENQHVFNHW
ncbi:hypothetical protein SPRG_15447 [Saprolegnia parasitica CBS 223.65]|uniref:Uncharacterized protein n=1 Tax=Saprolegnia parasitica (strain CBS 223.65) TaxID=695850 RepID=A0A067BJ70_SAPPC|nr:hypothetical protein SPRG_15447 [Saprolegnia parasitica CBS 223.65]KDO18479.1 hypothetical protein SPRG_15447 [Saprolegnia parasitica CBS 223.65]|eukprot:XP_012210812.1 hypothetical protein SPRG_15447 [Saprolegnia parasitica CBS 223.65]